MRNMASNESNLLAIVIDANPIWWGLLVKRSPVESFTRCLDSIIVACNSFLMLRPQNKICIVVNNGTQNRIIYPKRTKSSDENMTIEDLGDTIREGIKDVILKSNSGCELKGDCVFTGALSMALSYIDGVQKETPPTEKIASRILIIKGSKDNPYQYMDLMSIIQTSQKMDVVIDACILDNDSCLLKQACECLDGIYFKLSKMTGFLEYLMFLYMPCVSNRAKMFLPPNLQTDHKTACFCHKNLVDIGFVCSVCLTISCSYNPICITCQSTGRINNIQMQPRKKMKRM